MAASASAADAVRRSLRLCLAGAAVIGLAVVGLVAIPAVSSASVSALDAACTLRPAQPAAYVVPAGVYAVTVDAYGEAGGAGLDATYHGGGEGGLGAHVTVPSIPVTPGQKIWIGYIDGGVHGYTDGAGGGSGGRGTWVATAPWTGFCPPDGWNLLAVAGGGGGGGGGDEGGPGGTGGNADTPGNPGGSNQNTAGGGGGAGTMAAPGAGGASGAYVDFSTSYPFFTETFDNPGYPGQDTGTGGNGNESFTRTFKWNAGGGGGGGYLGGGGGGASGDNAISSTSGSGAGGGGGGGSYPLAGVVGTSTSAHVEFTPIYTPGVTLISSVNPQVVGSPVTFTATVVATDPGSELGGGTVSFGDATSGVASEHVPLGDVVLTLDSTGRIGTASITVSGLAAGPRRIEASYSGFSGYAADDPDHVLPIESPASFTRLTQTMLKVQTVTFTAAPTAGTADGGTDRPAASSTSGLPVSIDVAPDSRAICSLADDGVLSYLQGGTCVLEATQAGNDSYAPAPPVQLSIPVTGATSQTIIFTTRPPDAMDAGDTYTPHAVGGGSGNPVVITSLNPVACPIVAGVVTARLGGLCAVRADQAAGNGYSAAATVQQQIQVNPVPGHMLFLSTPPDSPQIGDQYTVVGQALYPSWGAENAVLSVDAASTACTMSTPIGTMVAGKVAQQAVVTYTAVGRCIIDANVVPSPERPDTAVQPIAELQQISTVAGAAQLITFTSVDPDDPTYGGSTTVSATSSSGLPVTFISTTPATCSVSGPDVSFVGAGECDVRASQGGDTTTWGPAPTVTKSLPIAPAELTITAPSGSAAYGAAPSSYAPAYDGFVADDDATSLTERPACSGPSTIADVGTHPVTCSGAADPDYTFVYVAGVQTITKAPQSVAFTSTAPTGALVGDSYTPTVSGGDSSFPVVIGSDSPGICTVADGVVTFVARGVCEVTADQAGDDNHAAADSVVQQIAVAGLPQQIASTSSVPTGAVVGDTYTPAATGGGSGAAVQIGVSTPGTCEVAGGVVSFIGAGSCVVVFNQAGTSRYAPAPEVTQTVIVGKASQSVAFTSAAPEDAMVGNTYTPTVSGGESSFPVVIGSDSPGICTVADGVVTFVARGVCEVTADQAGDDNHAAADSVVQRVAVAGLPQQIVPSSSVPTGAVVGDTYTPAATGGGSGAAVQIGVTTPQRCSMAGGVVSFIGAGSCVVVFNQAGTSRYAPAPEVTQTVVVGKTSQRVAFTSAAPAEAVVGDSYTPSVVGGGSGSPVVVETSTPDICTVAGGTATFIGAGDCVLVATQAGDAYYATASPARQTVVVREATPPTCEAIVAIADAPAVVEGDAGTVDLVFRLTVSSRDDCGDLSISVAITGGTARAGSDFIAPSSPVALSADATSSGELRVAVRGDAAVEPDETIVVTLSGVTGDGNPTVGNASAAGTIIDDDDALRACRPGAPTPPGYTVVRGTPGADRLLGTRKNEIFLGGAGDDRINGARGNDILCGNAGDDVLIGGPGNDRLSGGAGDDRLVGGTGHDRFWRGPGDDRILDRAPHRGQSG